MTRTGLLAASVAVSALTVMTTSAMAGGFALKERSTKGQGLSFAGVSAGSGGLSSMGFNPAAIGVVQEGFNNGEISGGLSFIQPIADGVVTVNGQPTGETADPARFAGLANSYVGYRLEDDILIGLGLYTPFGLTTSYEAGWVGQADGLTSQLLTLNFAPTVAWEPIPELTLAASMNILYADARLTSSLVNLDGNQTDLGFGVGIMWQPTDSTSIGIGYQHGHDLTLTGTAQGAVTGGAVLPVSAAAELPATVSLGIVQGITDNFRIMGEAQWQNWSRFDRIDITIGGGAVNLIESQNYDDAFFFAGGVEYDFTPSFTLRAGAAYDQTPTNDGQILGEALQVNNVNATNRTVRVPDEDRVWLSLGASYALDEHMSMDVGYSYVFALEDSVVGVRRAAPGTQVTYDAGAHIFSIGGSLKF